MTTPASTTPPEPKGWVRHERTLYATCAPQRIAGVRGRLPKGGGVRYSRPELEAGADRSPLPRRQRRRRMNQIKRSVPSIAVSALLLTLLVRQLPAGALSSLLGGIAGHWLIVATALYIAVNALRAVRFALLLPQQKVPAAAYLPVAFAVSLLNNVLPMRGGELSFVLLMKARYEASMAEATAALGMARLFDYLAVSILFVPLAWLARDHLPARTNWPLADTPTQMVLTGAMGFLLLTAIVALSLPWLGKRSVAIARGLTVRMGVARLPIVGRALSFADRLVAAVAELRRGKTYALLLTLSLGLWLVLFGWLYAFVLAFGFREQFGRFILGATFAVLSKAIPIPTVGGMGIAESGWTLGFSLTGWPAGAAIASGLGVTALTILVSAVFGLPSLWFLSRGRPSWTTRDR